MALSDEMLRALDAVWGEGGGGQAALAQVLPLHKAAQMGVAAQLTWD